MNDAKPENIPNKIESRIFLTHRVRFSKVF